jgi:hypothetical protein
MSNAGDPAAPSLGQLADRLRRLTLALAVEVAMIVPIRDSRPGLLVVIATGSQRRVRVSPETVFRPALRLRAHEVVLVHNHLDEGPVSAWDLAVTRRLVAVGALLGVGLRAHLVVGPLGWSDCCRPDSAWNPYPSEAVA